MSQGARDPTAWGHDRLARRVRRPRPDSEGCPVRQDSTDLVWECEPKVLCPGVARGGAPTLCRAVSQVRNARIAACVQAVMLQATCRLPHPRIGSLRSAYA